MLQPAVLQALDANASLIPPDLQRQLNVASYVIVGATAVLVWDNLHSFADDCSILLKLKFRFSTAVYFVSRIASLVYALGFSLFATYPLTDCQVAMIAFNSFYPVSSASTALLFFCRVRAVYDRQRCITWMFGILWICVVGGALTIPIASTATKIGSACVVEHLARYLISNGIATTVYDTSVFLAISFRLLANSRVEQTPRDKVRATLCGEANLYAFSQALFRDGQTYYLITVFTNALTFVMICVPGVSPVYRGMFAIPNVVLTNIMASRVYRNVRLHHVVPQVPHLSLLPTIHDSVTMDIVVDRHPSRAETEISCDATSKSDNRHRPTVRW